MLQIDWNVPPDEWEQALSQCPGATYFHTDAWLRAASLTFGTRVERVRFSWTDGRWALLPLSIRPLAKGLVPLATAGETGAYSGLASPDVLSPEALAQAYAAARKRYPALWVVGNPFARQANTAALAGCESEAGLTHVLTLKPLTELRQNFSRGAKSRGNKARRAGLTLRLSTDPADARTFYVLYEDTMRRWGEKLTWARPLAFYEHMLAEGQPHVRLFLACEGNRVVSGLLFAEYGGVAHYVAGSTLASALGVCPSNFLIEEAMAFYAEAGCHTFDFGPSNGLAGVIQFKESFGAQTAPFMAQRATSPASRLYFALRDRYERLRELSERLKAVPAEPLPAQVQPAGT